MLVRFQRGIFDDITYPVHKWTLHGAGSINCSSFRKCWRKLHWRKRNCCRQLFYSLV